MIKDSIKNIFRYKNRYIFFGILLLAVFCASIITMIIYDTANEKIEEIKMNFGSVFKLRRSADELTQSVISKDEFLEIAESEYVKEVKFFRYLHFIYTSYILIDPETYQFIDRGGIKINNSEYVSVCDNPFYHNICLIGYNTKIPDSLHEDKNVLKLHSGRMVEKDGECVISIKFYKDFYDTENTFFKDKNLKIEIGDKLSVIEKLYTGHGPDDYIIIEKSFEIVGIAEISRDDIYLSDSRVIYTTIDDSYYYHHQNNGQHSIPIPNGFEALYYLHSYEDGEKFMDEVNIKSKYGEFLVEYAKNGFKLLIAPLEKIQTTCKTFINILLIINAFIMMVMTLFSLNERKYDIGVLSSIGMSKPKIIFSFIFEILFFIFCIIALSFILGAGISNLPYFTHIVNANGVNIQRTRIIFETGIKIIFLALGLAVFSASFSILFILKYRPMKILRNRN